MADLGKLARDTGMILLGFGLLNVQKAQVRRREIEKELRERLGPLAQLLPPPLKPR
ncbi:MAG TPA: hypothetical protein VGR90_10430 [Acidimicrobiales bacterium]|nr:hypothetical protein [Acidimicrobiales bacterium]